MPREKISQVEEHFGTTPEGWMLLAVPNGKPFVPGTGRLDDRAFVTRKFATENFNQSGVRGPQGISGQPGTDGPRGATGEMGDTGAKGLPGISGAAGPSGTVPVEATFNDSIAKSYFNSESLGIISSFSGGQGWDGFGRLTGAEVVSRSRFGLPTERRIQLINGQMGRKFRWGSHWNRVLLSIALRVDSLVSFTGNYYFGICSGTDNMPGDATTTNFVGLAGASAGTINWTRTLGTKLNHYVNSAGIMASRNGVTTTVRDTSSVGLRIAEDEGNTLIISVGITRTRPDLDYIVFDVKSSAAAAQFHSGKQTSEFTSLRSQVVPGLLPDSNTAPTFSMTEGPGVLDSFNFSWISATPVEVAAISAVRQF